MKQLELKLTGFDLKLVLEYFEKATMYRWYPEEIISVVKSIVPGDQALIDHYHKNKNLWYRDEIIHDLKQMMEIGL